MSDTAESPAGGIDQAQIEKLGSMIDELLAKQPEVATQYNQVFQGSEVAEQWLAFVQTPETPAATVESAGEASSPEGDQEFEVLVTTSDLTPLLESAIRDDIWPALVEEFGLEDLQQNETEVTTQISAAIAAEVNLLLLDLTSKANGLLLADHAIQGAD